MKKIIVISSLLVSIVACQKLLPAAPDDDSILDGPVEGLTGAQHAQFLAGDIAFNDEVFTKEKGLGSIFVSTSCGSCHAGDGKGHPFTTLTRFGQVDSAGNLFLTQGGPQLQNRAIPGYLPEQIPAGATHSSFTPPANTGLGFLDAVSDSDIFALADPNDLNGDGISGNCNWNFIPGYCNHRPNTIERNNKYICRFGKKGATYDLFQQTVNAYNQDIGITSTYEPKDVYSGLPIGAEVSDRTVNDVVFYLRTLKAPVQRAPDDADVVAGKQLFMQLKCSSCHTPTLQTGYSAIEPLSFKTIHPYTDMLLHDMGAGLDDGYTEGTAKTSEWRTPALWGLGLSTNSQGGNYFLLHDGRARTIEQAIVLHGGEATQSRNAFQQLNTTEKSKLLKFLESL